MTSSKESPPTLRATLEKQLDLVIGQNGARKGKAFLMVSTGEAAGTVFPLTHSSLLIGRSPDAEVRINEQAISNEHARLEVEGARFTLRDLGSTNGTYVNGQRLVDAVTLAGGDSIRAGSTTFTFVTRESGMPAGTVRLRNPDPHLPITPRGASGRPYEARRVSISEGPDSEGEKSISLTDVVRTVKTYWVYVRRYSWLAATATFFGIAVGIAQARINPPPGSAWFEMTLIGESRKAEEDGIHAFVAAESTFRSLPLIKKTLAELGAGEVADGAASDIQSALSFEQAGYNSKLWRGNYQDSTAALAVTFLTKHVDVYVSSEIDKILTVLRADAAFDRDQEAQAERQVSEARNRLIEFIDEHPDAVPKDAKVPDRPSVRLAPGASAEKIAQSITNTERSLRGAYSNIQSKKARSYIEQAAGAETKIADARGRGLRDEHPEIKNLLNVATTMRARANQILNAEPSPSEQSLDPEVVRLQQELAELKARLAAAPSAGQASEGEGAAHVKVSAAERPVQPQSLAQLKLQYAELAREYERAKVDHDALRKKRETTDRQLERERTSAEARYSIITPPTPEATSMAATMLKRGGMGGIVALTLALIAAACLEIRRTLIARGHL